ncbi:hypothetical protein HNP55_001074 [Paucibacter oligotrophus]|uniref:HipA-like C-terminal domain-containing protein n=1 Tax=Roseateles oligotrophus TaxID=1769250 RepID=A0A840L8U8_9BURK|nr:HipA domain-containing protein [Roseateles oligotrophus]MBB4842559.1 hypothetical protein [Roseateles oligotrophus]
MAETSREQQIVLAALAAQGLLSSAQMQQLLGKSQPSVSRLLAEMSAAVLPLGRGKSTLYGLPLSIHGRAAQQQIFWTTASGQTQEFGRLSLLAGQLLHIESPWIKCTPSRALPWFLSPVQAQGFLGRLLAGQLQGAGLDSNPERWGLADILFAALHLPNASGALSLGDAASEQLASGPSPGPSPSSLPRRLNLQAAALDQLAQDIARTLPAGSSAGGEQPKFLTQMPSGKQVLVKFTPPRGTPFGERWHDLLHAEQLASQLLQEAGIAAAATQIIESPLRSYLLSERFDRVGAQGRRHVLAVGAVHQGFVADAYQNWALTSAALARQKRLPRPQAEQAAWALAFGRLIGNTDMHAGNLSFFVELQDLARGRFTLAPIYDMLPMRWRPNPTLGGLPDYQAIAPDTWALQSPAAPWARRFWLRLSEQGAVSPGLRKLAKAMAATIPA